MNRRETTNGAHLYLEFVCLMCCEINRLQNSISPAMKACRVKWTMFPKAEGMQERFPRSHVASVLVGTCEMKQRGAEKRKSPTVSSCKRELEQREIPPLGGDKTRYNCPSNVCSCFVLLSPSPRHILVAERGVTINIIRHSLKNVGCVRGQCHRLPSRHLK